MHPKDTLIEEYDYELADERIAKYPLPQRDQSKLLVYNQGQITASTYSHLHQFIPEGYSLICNNTKVIEARLLFQKNTGASIEIFCLEPSSKYSNIETALQQSGSVEWLCLIGGASKWKPGLILELVFRHDDKHVCLKAEYVSKQNDRFLVRFHWEPEALRFVDVLHSCGNIPLPPYLHRKTEPDDAQRYQTVFADKEGSVAAPTASLHFTKEVITHLADKNIQLHYVTLHVGAGTFKPVKSDRLADHTMHAEFISVSKALIEHLKQQMPNIIAVGTTSLRTIESVYWMGVKAKLQPECSLAELEIRQWDVYELPKAVPVNDALDAILHWMNQQGMNELLCTTQLLMAPPYEARVAQALITNFHQPKSTLLLLVASFVGDTAWKRIYDYALQHDFRFLSYGDGSLLWKKRD